MQQIFKRQDEKSAIITRFIKRREKNMRSSKSYEFFVRQWLIWFKDDFRYDDKKYKKFIGRHVRLPVTGKVFDEKMDFIFGKLFEDACEKWVNVSISKMKDEVNEFRTHEQLPVPLRKQLREKGMCAFTAHINDHPNQLSGYQMRTINGNKLIAGKDFSLSVDDIVNILKEQENGRKKK